MIESFTCNPNAAASVASSQYIQASGAYYVTIAQATISENDKGSVCVELSLKSDDGQLAFPRLWIIGKDGQKTFSHNIFDALLAVCGVKHAPVVKGKIYDRFENTWKEGYRIPAIEKKHIGVILQKEISYYISPRDGCERTRNQLNLLTPFNVETKKVAAEIIQGLEGKRLDQVLATLKDREGNRAVQPRQPNQPSIETLDEDIPF